MAAAAVDVPRSSTAAFLSPVLLSGLSSSPSGSLVSSCSESVRLNAKMLGLANDPGKEAPNVAVDGRHAVVAYQALGFNRRTRGAYVYERDEGNG